MQLKSPAYQAGSMIPVRYTCEGENISPEFSWSDPPAETKSLAFLLFDSDSPRDGGFTHWMVYNIEPDINQIDEDTPKLERVPGLGCQGLNDSGKIGYVGPCPSSGIQHRYFARLFALDTELDLRPGASYQELVAAMDGHILEHSALMGTYIRKASRVA